MTSATPPPTSDMLSDRDPLADLSRWAADARVVEAARSRGRARWLRQLSAEETSFTAVLVNLAERRNPVVLTTATNRRHRAVVEAVATDFCAVRTDQGQHLLIAMDAVSSVRPDGRANALSGQRSIGLDLCLGDALGRLVTNRTWVLLTSFGADETLRGELTSVGHDVVTLRLADTPRSYAYVRLAAIAEVVVGAR